MAQTKDYNLRRAAEILKSVLYATVATSSNNQPWNTPVAKFMDNSLNIYWFSDRLSTHSGNIRENNKVFIVVYDSTMPEGTGEGVFIEAQAHEIDEPEAINRIAKLQTGTWKVSAEEVSDKAAHRFYQAIPGRIWINDIEEDDNGKYLRDIRVELDINEIIERL